MADNYVRPGATLAVTAPATVSAGGLVVVGTNLVGVALNGAASAATVEIATEGVWNLTAAVTNTATVVGQKAYYDATNNAISVTSSAGYVAIGVFTAAKVTSTTDVQVRFNGAF